MTSMNSHAKYSLRPHIVAESMNASGQPNSKTEKCSSSRLCEELRLELSELSARSDGAISLSYMVRINGRGHVCPYCIRMSFWTLRR